MKYTSQGNFIIESFDDYNFYDILENYANHDDQKISD